MIVHRFAVTTGPSGPVGTGSAGKLVNVLQVDENLFTGERQFADNFGAPTTLESDMLRVAAAIFAADRAALRGVREDVCRTIQLTVPVVNVSRLLPLIPQVEEVLRLLSNDAWEIALDATAGVPERAFAVVPPAGKTLLFSGGLDSLAAAVEFGVGPGELELVSHVTRNTFTSGAQRVLAERVERSGGRIRHRQFFVSSRDGGPTNLKHAEENSQRTRSFIFLVLGALVARRTGHLEIVYLAENGQLAIHLPLTQGRIGAFSTHTAHPDVLVAMREFLSAALEAAITIENPYVYSTKREVVQQIASTIPDAIAEAKSCWKNARLPAGATHCGECIPCYVRRIAVEHLLTTDPTAYARDVWNENVRSLPPEDDGRRNLMDLVEFIRRFQTETGEELMSEFPELYSENMDAEAVIAMYRRFANEAAHVLGGYPHVVPIMA